MRPRSKSFIKKSDLKQSKKSLDAYIDVFNSRLTKKLSPCRINVYNGENETCLCGGVKINFAFKDDVIVRNNVVVNGIEEDFLTSFKFSTKARLVIPLCDHDTVEAMLDYLMEKFCIVPEERERLVFYERELSISQQDIFYRKLSMDEIPLDLFLLWRINGERKSLVLMDYDPNEKKYAMIPEEDLEQRLQRLDDEESRMISAIEANYAKAKVLLHNRLFLEKDQE